MMSILAALEDEGVAHSYLVAHEIVIKVSSTNSEATTFLKHLIGVPLGTTRTLVDLRVRC